VSNSNSTLPEDKPITQKQKDLIEKIAGRKGLTTEGLEKAIQGLFDKDLDRLDRVQASFFIQHLNG
jgi:BMFP domain-containing protein YqiC